MNLPAPNLDDRTFQQLVDEAKHHIQRRCPTWTNHNVSDPGVTLVETFAWMTDQLLYRLNRVPDRNYVKFLELLGVTLFEPAAARVEMSFRLSSHQPVPVRVPAGSVVSTLRTPGQPAISFATTDELVIVPAVSRIVATLPADGGFADRTAAMGVGAPFPAFAERPQVGDALYVGLDRPAPGAIVLLQFVCRIGGHGIDPSAPPLRWEAWTGTEWSECTLERDDTKGLNVSGGVEVHVPAGHTITSVGTATAAWLRCTVVEATGRRPYRSSPLIVSCTAATIGGDVAAVNADPVAAEVVGVSDGTSGQTFAVLHPPVLRMPDDQVVLEVLDGASVDPAEWQEWARVDTFAESTAEDRHFAVEPTTGELTFGPVVRSADGTLRRYGAVPPKGAVLRVRRYWTGGGARGNVAPRMVGVLRSSIPYVATVYNRLAATGGVDGETVEEAKLRGPIELRSRNRAVTAEDYEYLTRQAAPSLARVRCVPAGGAAADGLRVLVVPDAPSPDGRIALGRLRLPESVRDRVVAALEERRMVGVRVSVEPPSYVGIRFDVRLRTRPDAAPERVEQAAATALYGYFNPLTGGPRGDGWPFGRPVQVGEVYAVLGRVPGVDFVEEAVLFRANPLTKELSPAGDRIDLEATHLVFSVEHDIVATPSEVAA
ncbi:putative baseplate assembly protein [Dactylosporangium sp. NPDC049525]|uniref:putative baseplate assembly protein n=1 Tax=Dactylosporangium sp. NPDC049525 TaxID=3154730 RepID=UPI00341C6230